MSTEVVTKELKEYTKNQFDHLNPYEKIETEPRVWFAKTVVCENKDTLEVDEYGNACTGLLEENPTSGQKHL